MFRKDPASPLELCQLGECYSTSDNVTSLRFTTWGPANGFAAPCLGKDVLFAPLLSVMVGMAYMLRAVPPMSDNDVVHVQHVLCLRKWRRRDLLRIRIERRCYISMKGLRICK